MKIDIAAWFTGVKSIVTDTKIMVKAILFIVSIAATYAITISTISKAKAKPCEDCSFFKNQNKELLDALLGIKKDIQVAAQTNYIMDNQSTITVMYASYDTIPKKKTQQQIKLGVIASRIDSIMWRMNQKTQQQMQQQQRKN